MTNANFSTGDSYRVKMEIDLDDALNPVLGVRINRPSNIAMLMRHRRDLLGEDQDDTIKAHNLCKPGQRVQ